MQVSKPLFCIILLISISNCIVFPQLVSRDLPPYLSQKLQEFLGNAEKAINEGNEREASRLYSNAAYLCWEHQSTSDAVAHFKKSLELNKNLNNHNGVKTAAQNIGMIYLDADDYENASFYLDESLRLNRRIGKKEDIAGNLINFGISQIGMGQHNQAINNLEEALNLSKEVNNMDLIRNCYRLLAESYEKTGNADKSFEYYNLFAAIQRHQQQQEVSRLESHTKVVEAQKREREIELRKTADTLRHVEGITREQQMQIDLLNKEKEIQDLQIKEQEARLKHTRLVILSFIGGSILLGVIVFILYWGFLQKRKSNAKLARQNKEILEQQEIIKLKNLNITKSINYANRIQRALFPSQENIKKLLPESFILFKPRDIVSGDFYWFSGLNINSLIKEKFVEPNPPSKIKNEASIGTNNKPEPILVAAVDCTGHGIPGAFMSVLGYNLMHEIISNGITEPKKILEALDLGIRNQLNQYETDNRDGMDIALCRINFDTNTLDFAGAKNSLVFIVDNELYQIKGDYIPIGGLQVDDKKDSYTQHKLRIEKPMTCYIFSDGYHDQMGGPEGKKFMSNNFKEFLKKIHHLPMEEQKHLLQNTFDEWCGNDYNQIDDILVMGFRLQPSKKD